MEYSIAINKQFVLQSIKEITGYTGKSSGEGVDRVMVTDDESHIIESLFDKSITDFLSKLSGHTPVYSEAVFKVDLPKTFDQKVIPLLSKGVGDLIVNDVCSSWFFIARMEEDAKKYAEMANNSFFNVMRLFCSRVKPH